MPAHQTSSLTSSRIRIRAQVALLVLLAALASAKVSGGPSPKLHPPPDPKRDMAPFDIASIGRPSLQTFTSKDGLPQNAITSIVTSSDGLLWIGTKDGLASYNGRTWQVLNIPAEFGDNRITHIVPRTNGDMWVLLTGGSVVCRLADGTWKNYPHPTGRGYSMPVYLCEVDEPDRPDTIALVAQHSFHLFVDGEWVSDPTFPDSEGGTAGAVSAVVGEDGVQEIWTGLPGGRTARRRLGEWTVFQPSPVRPDENYFCFIRTTAIDGRSRVVAGRHSGLWEFDGSTWRPVPGATEETSRLDIISMCESRTPEGATILWCGSLDGWTYRYSNGKLRRFASSARRKDGGVWSLLASGNEWGTHALWIGTAGLGLIKAQFGDWVTIDRNSGLINDSVYSVLVTRDRHGGDVAWVGTLNAGVVRIERGVPKQVDLEIGNKMAWALCLLDTSDESTERVLAGYGGGLVVIENGRAVKQFDQNDGLRGHDVPALLKSVDQDGRDFVWVGTSGGISIFRDGRIVAPPPALEALRVRITALAESRSTGGGRNLWIGTDHGLFLFDGEGLQKYGMDQGLPTDLVMSLKEVTLPGAQSELWVGTRAGLARLSLADSTRPVRILSTSSVPALPNNTVYRVEQDGAGRLYLPTNRGVARLTPRPSTAEDSSEFELTVFTTQDGLPNDECNTGASTIDPRGRIWVGTLSGAAIFDPKAELVAAPSRLVIERRSVVDDAGRQLAENDELAHDQNHLVFEYALLSYVRQTATRYRTQLEGYESRPSDWTPDFRREFNSLPAGHYTFRVWGRDASGNVTGPVEISFRVLPPLWWTWWAIASYFVAALALGMILGRWRLRSISKRNLFLEAAIAERTAELGRTVDELRVSQQEALAANRAKSVFLANMSHELRTPLNAVLGFAQLLDRVGRLGSTERQQVSIIRKSGEHLLGLINEVLSLAKIEAGKLELTQHPFSPVELLATVESMTRVRAEAKDLRLEVRIGSGFPDIVVGDEGKLRQVLLNLLGNAVKFSATGTVRLAADWRDGRAYFDVSDDGEGIAREDIERLFEAFAQTQVGRTATEGTGLGLAISRQIVVLMGGDISVRSESGQGSSFSFDVPLPASAGTAATQGELRVRRIADLDQCGSVLVVDDSEENRLMLSALLSSVGLVVHEASDGREAIEVFRELRPRVIFMDRRMPVVDGVEATREIRRLESLDGDAGRRAVIIATTASVFEEDREEILANGCDDLVIKPFQESEIFEQLRRHAGIEFEYEDEAEADCEDDDGSNDGLGSLGALDGKLLERLYAALSVGDATAAAEIADEIRATDRKLGSEISSRIQEFRLDSLLDELERIVE